MIMDMRETGKNVLRLCIKKEKNINIMEKHILNICLQKKCRSCEESYNQLIISVYIRIKGGEDLKSILKDIKDGRVLWDDPNMDEHRQKLEEQDEFLENPFEIEDGVIECNKCGSKRTYSYTKQTRSGDEATTVFSVCAKCGAKWKT